MVRRFCDAVDLKDRVWQFPVVLLPVALAQRANRSCWANPFGGTHDRRCSVLMKPDH